MSKRLRNKLLCNPDICYFCDAVGNPENTSFRSIIEIHHIIEKNQGGKDESGNLIPVCSNHHSLIHEGKIRIDRWYFSTGGWVLHWYDSNGVEKFGNK